MIKKSDARITQNDNKQWLKPTHIDIPPPTEAELLFVNNKQLGPPFRILLDTSFINYCVRYRIDIFQQLFQLLAAKCIPIITDCIMAELEKNQERFKIALKLAKDPRIQRIHCKHECLGYGDDCLCLKVSQSKIYMVATNDRELRQRIRKIPGIPILYAKRNQQIGIEGIAPEDL